MYVAKKKNACVVRSDHRHTPACVQIDFQEIPKKLKNKNRRRKVAEKKNDDSTTTITKTKHNRTKPKLKARLNEGRD